MESNLKNTEMTLNSLKIKFEAQKKNLFEILKKSKFLLWRI